MRENDISFGFHNPESASIIGLAQRYKNKTGNIPKEVYDLEERILKRAKGIDSDRYVRVSDMEALAQYAFDAARHFCGGAMLFLRDNTNGRVHRYSTNQHDSLILDEEGKIQYLNLQNGTGTLFPEEGYSFCDSEGRDINPLLCGDEVYLDIGGVAIASGKEGDGEDGIGSRDAEQDA